MKLFPSAPFLLYFRRKSFAGQKLKKVIILQSRGT